MKIKMFAAFGAGLLVMAILAIVFAYLGRGEGDNDAARNVTGTPGVTSTSSGNASLQDESCLTAAEIYKNVRSSVVEIDISGSTAFGGISGTGSGIVLDDEGHILTNNHVIAGAGDVSVLFDDGESVSAQVLGTDAQNDLAVIKVDPSERDLSPATLGNSGELRVGDPVLALGNPFNLEGSLTQGIVSGLNRAYSEGSSTRPIRGMIQTDAAINPGNSGGPLLNCYGEVVGVNTLLENPTGDSVNIGVAFAVAIDTATAELDALKAGEDVDHAWLGIAGADITSTLQEQLDLPVSEGVYVTLVTPDSPADEAGLVGAFRTQSQANSATELPPGGDVIVSADGEAMASIDELATYLDRNKSPRDTVELVIVRQGEELTITATLAPWPGG